MKVVLFHHLQKGNAPEVARKVCLALHRNGMEVWADPAVWDCWGICPLSVTLRFWRQCRTQM